MATHKRLLNLQDNPEIALGGAIVEVGSQRSPGKGSSFQLKALADHFSQEFFTVDLSRQSFEAASSAVGACAVHEDGISFLEGFDRKISILYLDNYDIVYSATHAADIKERMSSVAEELNYSFDDQYLQNTNSIFAHLHQAQAALPKMTSSCLIGLDDTLSRNNSWWGKGALAAPFLLHNGFEMKYVEDKGLVVARNFPFEF